MRKILFLLFLLPLLVTAQIAHPIKKTLDMEYLKGVLDANNKLWTFGITYQTLTTLPDGGTIVDASTAFNAFLFVSSMGHVYVSGFYNTSGLSSLTQISTDSSGTTISDATAIWGFESTYWIKRAGGAIWQGGNDFFQILGTSGATLRPFKITPGSVSIGVLRPSGSSSSLNPLIGISSDSLTAYEWGPGSGASPTTLTTTIGTHKFIDGCTDGGNQYGYANFFQIQMSANSAYGHICVVGNNWILYGKTSSATYSSLHDISADLTLPVTKEFSVNNFVCVEVDSLHNMYELGGYNMQGQLGIGQELVNKYTYSNSRPNYGWSFITTEDPTYGVQQIGTGHSWNHINNEGFFVFYNDARDLNDSLYSWGRGKQNILGQGYQMDANDYANHPNCCDLLTPTLSPQTWMINNPPFTAFTLPTWSAGSQQNISTNSTTLTASGSAALITLSSTPFTVLNYTISSTAWTQVSGPNTATISSPSTLSTVVSGLIPGTYVFQNTETDNNTGTNLANVTVIVSSTNTPPTVSAGPNQTITLPTSSVTLAGSASANSPATSITTYAWAQLSGPNTGTFSNTAIAGPTFSGLIAGTYVLKLTATDNNGNTNSATVNIVVNTGISGCSCIVTPF
jgi:hypothetical protein